jgi:hypothetical protein
MLMVIWVARIVSVPALAALVSPAAAPTFQNSITIPAETTDLFPLGPGQPGGANVNRLGMFSDLYYHPAGDVFYGLSDRGPGGGVLDYQTRVQQFNLSVDPLTGAISSFQIAKTILFTQNGQPFNGLNPQLLNGSAGTLGRSFDPEGFAVGRNGNFFVSDEYGPSVFEFTPTGQFLRAFTPPANLLPRQGDGTLNFVDGRPTITTGRQDNRGYEGPRHHPGRDEAARHPPGPPGQRGKQRGQPGRPPEPQPPHRRVRHRRRSIHRPVHLSAREPRPASRATASASAWLARALTTT